MHQNSIVIQLIVSIKENNKQIRLNNLQILINLAKNYQIVREINWFGIFTCFFLSNKYRTTAVNSRLKSYKKNANTHEINAVMPHWTSDKKSMTNHKQPAFSAWAAMGVNLLFVGTICSNFRWRLVIGRWFSFIHNGVSMLNYQC